MGRKIFVCTFLSMICIISFLDIVGEEKDFSNFENRYLKKKPKFTLSKFLGGEYSEELDVSVNDQFFMRDTFINLKSLGENILAKKENNGIVYGKESFMFSKNTKIDKKQIQLNIEAIREFINRNKDLNSKVMIVPYASEIYKEYVPKGLKLIDEEQCIKEIGFFLGGNYFINPINILNKNKDKNIYYKTDHHWTTYGSYLGYLELSNAFNLAKIDINDLSEKSIDDFWGTHYRKSKKYNTKGEYIKYYEMKNLSMNINGIEYPEVYVYDKKNSEDKHEIFLKGNNPLTIIKNKNEKMRGKKLIVFKDSFANSLIPFISNNYEEVHVIDLRQFNGSVKEYIKEKRFNDVLILYSFNSINKDNNIVKLKY